MKGFGQGFSAAMRGIFTDKAARSTLLVSAVFYSFYYPAPYHHQVASELPVMAIDQDRSPLSRELIRKTLEVRSVQLVSVGTEARDAAELVERGQLQGFMVIPEGFQRDVLRGTQPGVALFANGALLGPGSTTLGGLSDAVSGFGPSAALAQSRFQGSPLTPALELIKRPLFNTKEGYGSVVVPAVGLVVVHQTLLLGIALLAGTWRERRGRLRFSPGTLLGVGLAFFTLGMASFTYYAGLVPWLQDYPRGGNPLGGLLAGALFVASVVAFGLFLGSFFRSRERGFQTLVLTSLPLFFLTHVSWPKTSSPEPLSWLARLLPSTSGVNALIKLNVMGATLSEAQSEVLTLLALLVLYAGLAAWRYRPHAPATPSA